MCVELDDANERPSDWIDTTEALLQTLPQWAIEAAAEAMDHGAPAPRAYMQINPALGTDSVPIRDIVDNPENFPPRKGDKQ
jgi:hypothetical protein